MLGCCIAKILLKPRNFFTRFQTFSIQFKSISQKGNHPKSHLVKMKIDTPEFRAIFTPELKKLLELFEQYKYEMRIAGGAVRDLLTDKAPHDIDFATTATPDEMKTMFDKEEIRMINTKGEKHGTITARINDKENFEVTTLRIDVRTDGRHAEVEWTKDWQLDALRRDLTINSMFLGFDGTVYDYFNGINDLNEKKVRFVGSAADRIQEDYLRILRYFRFYGRVSDEPDSHETETLNAIRENMHGLSGISGERIWVEVKKILTGRYAGHLVIKMVDLGMAQYIGLPNELKRKEFTEVCERCQGLDPQPMTLLSALLSSEEEVYELNKRLKMSREELRLGIFIINHRETDMGDDPFRTCQDIYCDTTGKETKTQDKICELLKYLNKRDTLTKFSQWTPPRFPVSGVKLLERGCPKGPALAKVLHELRQVWKHSAYTLTEEELLDNLEEIKEKLKL